MEKELTPDEVISELGGCGRFQWRLNIIVHLMKTLMCFSMTSMIVISATPPWRCPEADVCATKAVAISNGSVSICPKKQCTIGNKSCEYFQFDDDLTTMVSEVGEIVLGIKNLVLFITHIQHTNVKIVAPV